MQVGQVGSASQVQAADEQILVVKRSHLFPNGAWNGLRKLDFSTYINIIRTHKEFQPRSQMETNPEYKQIIPYLVFIYNDRYFLMQRRSQEEGTGEVRLQSKLTLGIGGHIRQEDMLDDDIRTWAQREFTEEVDYKGKYAMKPFGIINDDSNPVGQVHIGFVYLVQGDSPRIGVKSELKSGRLVTLEECSFVHDRMETWTQYVVDALNQQSKKSCC